jgi:hypothetical protein
MFTLLLAGVSALFVCVREVNAHIVWADAGRAPPDATITITVALTLRNLDVLESTLHKVADPRHADYGKLWTKRQIEQLTQPVSTPWYTNPRHQS